MFGEANNTHKFCTATDGPVLATGEHVTGGLVAARSLAAARGLFAHGWVGGPRGRMHQLFTHFTSMSMEVLASCKKSTSRWDRIWDVQPSKCREKWFWTLRLCVCMSCCRFSRELSRA